MRSNIYANGNGFILTDALRTICWPDITFRELAEADVASLSGPLTEEVVTSVIGCKAIHINQRYLALTIICLEDSSNTKSSIYNWYVNHTMDH